MLIAGIGNIFLSDDGFGPEVINHVPRPDNDAVRVTDYGIRGMHLAYDLMDGWDGLVLVDAIPARGAPGTVHVFEADLETLSATGGLDAHSMDPGAVFASLTALGGIAPRTVVVGCEVRTVEDGIGLSDQVIAAIPEAVRAVADALAMLREG
ncbi:hydrogenase maturation protease [soil metagenome]